MKNNEKQGVNVLIVDDVIANLIILTEIIKKAGYVARPVTSVRQAMDAITALPPNLILLDITMPEIDGFEYCSMLKKDVRTRDIPVIFISAVITSYSIHYTKLYDPTALYYNKRDTGYQIKRMLQ